MLARNTSLKLLNLSCNSLNESGGKILLEGFKQNEHLLKLDIRLTNAGKDVDLAVQEVIRRNKNRRVAWRLTDDPNLVTKSTSLQRDTLTSDSYTTAFSASDGDSTGDESVTLLSKRERKTGARMKRIR